MSIFAILAHGGASSGDGPERRSGEWRPAAAARNRGLGRSGTPPDPIANPAFFGLLATRPPMQTRHCHLVIQRERLRTEVAQIRWDATQLYSLTVAIAPSSANQPAQRLGCRLAARFLTKQSQISQLFQHVHDPTGVRPPAQASGRGTPMSSRYHLLQTDDTYLWGAAQRRSLGGASSLQGLSAT